MKKIWLILPLLLILFLGADNFPPRKRVGKPLFDQTHFSAAIGERQANWYNPGYIYAFNSHTDTLKVGHVVVWDDTKTLLVDSVAKVTACDTMIIGADSLASYQWSQVRILWNNTVSACSVDLKGKDTLNASQTETIVITGTRAFKYSTLLWRKVSLVIWRNGAANDSLCLWGIPYQSVTVTTSADNVNVCGVVAVQALADSIVKIQTSGMCQAYLKGATVEVLPGMTIQTAATAGYGAADATEVTGAGLGKATTSGNTDGLYWIQLDLQ